MNFTGDGDLCFVDTNILIYANSAPGPKQRVADRLLVDLLDRHLLRVSTQVLQELYVTLTKPNKFSFSPEKALIIVGFFLKLPVVIIKPVMVPQAAKLSFSSKISFWDALIVVAAKACGAKRLYTEDLSHGQKTWALKWSTPF